MLGASAMFGGCGGRSDSGAVATLPAPPDTRGTLKISNVTAKTVITVDGAQIQTATGTVSVQLTPGAHAVAVSRAGYDVDNSADLAAVSITGNAVTEKTLAFTRTALPLPGDWAVTAGRVAGGIPPPPEMPPVANLASEGE
jgi:hypothetical protein